MAADSEPSAPGRPVPDVVLPVPEIRDYLKINAELIHALDDGARLVRLAGVEGQRLLAHGLRGRWNAVVEVEGRAGPELAADLDAPGLTVVALGAVDDGAGRGLRSGRLLIHGDADDGLGYTQRGGVILAAGAAGARAGLDQAGGLLVIAGAVGRLAGERQRGGRLVLLGDPDQIGPFLGHGQVAGERVVVRAPRRGTCPPARELDAALAGLEPWLPPSLCP